MKKIVCLLLAVICAFSFASCSEDPDQAFFDTVEASSPTRIKTLTSYTPTEGGSALNGTFETAKNGETFVFSYEYQRYALIEDSLEGASNPEISVSGNIATITGKVYFEDGRYSKDRETWFQEAPDVMSQRVDFNLDKALLGEYEMNDGKTSLTTVLTKENAEKVLGMTLNGAGDVTLTVSTNGTNLTRVLVSYSTATASVTINTSYS